MNREQATTLWRLLVAAFPRQKVGPDTADLWLRELLLPLPFEVGKTAIRSTIAEARVWPSPAFFFERVEKTRREAARQSQQEERRAAEAALVEMPRPPLREIPDLVAGLDPEALDMPGVETSEQVREQAEAVRAFLAREFGFLALPEAGPGECDDCGEDRPTLYRLGKSRLCADCARPRLRARAKAGAETDEGEAA